MLTKKLVLKLFEAFSIERWNDFIRPFEMIEMDKSAEKMVLAYIIGKFEENQGKKINWDWMIYASFFDLYVADLFFLKKVLHPIINIEKISFYFNVFLIQDIS